jgi:hypothetical protein
MKRAILAVLVGGAVFGSVFAMAATLGVTSNNLGAGADAVASCVDDVTTTYTTAYNTNSTVDPASTPVAGYKVTHVVVENIDATACAGQTLKVTLTDADDVNIGDGVFTVATSSANVLINPQPLAETVENVNVLITGVEP